MLNTNFAGLPTRIVVAFGSNEGDPAQKILAAFSRLCEEFEVLAESSVYETAPMYYTDQNRFLNGVWIFETFRGPRGVLRVLQNVEQELGRKRQIVNGPRPIDLDLIFYGCAAYSFTDQRTVKIAVPHPRIWERRFVLQPLADLRLIEPSDPRLQHVQDQDCRYVGALKDLQQTKPT